MQQLRAVIARHVLHRTHAVAAAEHAANQHAARINRQALHILGIAIKARVAHQVIFDVRGVKRGHFFAAFGQDFAHFAEGFVAREIADSRDQQIAVFQRANVLKIVFSDQVIALLAGQVFFQQQVPIAGIIRTRRAVMAGEFQIQSRAEKLFVNAPHRGEVLVVELQAKGFDLRCNLLARGVKTFAICRSFVEVFDNLRDVPFARIHHDGFAKQQTQILRAIVRQRKQGFEEQMLQLIIAANVYDKSNAWTHLRDVGKVLIRPHAHVRAARHIQLAHLAHHVQVRAFIGNQIVRVEITAWLRDAFDELRKLNSGKRGVFARRLCRSSCSLRLIDRRRVLRRTTEQQKREQKEGS